MTFNSPVSVWPRRPKLIRVSRRHQKDVALVEPPRRLAKLTTTAPRLKQHGHEGTARDEIAAEQGRLVATRHRAVHPASGTRIGPAPGKSHIFRIRYAANYSKEHSASCHVQWMDSAVIAIRRSEPAVGLVRHFDHLKMSSGFEDCPSSPGGETGSSGACPALWVSDMTNPF